MWLERVLTRHQAQKDTNLTILLVYFIFQLPVQITLLATILALGSFVIQNHCYKAGLNLKFAPFCNDL